ncbi:MAG TPA: DNA polymerase III subunit alpha, partial [Methylothermaceae bacterium]|nr:DNA polymerase III subunit alpha [Methylothermaceae bacterium]
LQAAEQHHRSQAQGQNDLFGLSDTAALPVTPSATAKVDPWPLKKLLAAEKAVLGFYLSGHPMDEYRHELQGFVSASLADLARNDTEPNADTRQVVVAGLVVELRARHSRQGKKMVFLTLEDGTGRLEVAVFAEVLADVEEVLEKDALLVVQGEIGRDDFTGNLRLVADRVWNLTQAREHFAKGIWIRWESQSAAGAKEQTARLAELLRAYRGGRCPVFVEYRNGLARTCLRLGGDWRVQPEDGLLQQLTRQFGQSRVTLRYD